MLQLRGRATPSPEVIMESLSRTYGWTPLEIMQQPAWVIAEYMRILEVRGILKKQYGTD